MFYTRFYRSAAVIRKFSSECLRIRDIFSRKPLNENLCTQGWVRAIRKHKQLWFVDLYDGTCFDKLQVVIEADKESSISFGSSIKVEGTLVESNHKGQDVEFLCKTWNTIGTCPPEYPFEHRQEYSPTYTRQFLHLRPRTKTFGSVLRVRSHVSSAVTDFLVKKDFLWTNTPIITRNDCEGAGEVFSVQGKLNSEEISQSDSDQESDQELDDENRISVDEDFDPKEFLGAPTYLTVSGQLHLESLMLGLTRVFNLGPVFRAENSHGRQHACEFTMLEVEMACESLDNLLKLVEELLKSVTKSLLDKCFKDVEWICKTNSKDHVEDHMCYLERTVSNEFVRLTYNEAINILENNRKSLNENLKWGDDIKEEHKRFLIKHCNNSPVFVTMLPPRPETFYLKEDGKGTCHCFDLYAPFGGEICGGSLREENANILEKKMQLLGIEKTLSWYLDLMKYGTVPHGGFGVGFDRFIQSLLGISQIRDVIPFPRRRRSCLC